MEYGYCRISRKTMNIERQVRNILGVAPNAKLFLEAFTGTKNKRYQQRQALHTKKKDINIAI